MGILPNPHSLLQVQQRLFGRPVRAFLDVTAEIFVSTKVEIFSFVAPSRETTFPLWYHHERDPLCIRASQRGDLASNGESAINFPSIQLSPVPIFSQRFDALSHVSLGDLDLLRPNFLRNLVTWRDDKFLSGTRAAQCNPGACSAEDCLGQERRNEPVWCVHNFANSKIHRDTRKCIGIVSAQPSG